MKAIKNHSGDFDIVDNGGNVIGEVSNWTGEGIFEQVSNHKLDLEDMRRIMELMEMCAMYPDKWEIE